MKIITYGEMEWDGEKYVTTYEESEEYTGPVAQCGGGGGDQTVTQRVDPRVGKYATGEGSDKTGYLPEAEKLFLKAKKNPFNADELAAMSMMSGRVNRDYSMLNTGSDYLNSAARGDYLGQQNFMDAYGEGILNEVNSRFGKANRTGSGYASQAAAKGLAQGAAPLYAQERQLQQQAAMALPGYESGRYGLLDADINALLQSGLMSGGRRQEDLANYANIVNSATSGNSQTSQPTYSNPIAGGLGGAMIGSQLLPFGPWGAIGGGLLGAFS